MTPGRSESPDVVTQHDSESNAPQQSSRRPPPATTASELPANDDGLVQVIRPPRNWELIDFAQLWQYRELAWVLATRDFKVRYKQAIIGAAWAVIQPAALAAVFAVFFELLGRRPVSPNVPLIVSFYCALLPWQLFATALKGSTESLVQHQAMIKKIYFPRVILPAVPIATAVIDFCIGFSVLVLLMLYYQIAPTWNVLWLPALVLFAAVTALAIGLWFSALTALYRDLRHVMPVLIQLWFFLSPVVYETNEIVPERYRSLYALNPMVGVIDGFRWALLGGAAPDVATMTISIASVLVLLVSGAFYFRRMERVFVDWI